MFLDRDGTLVPDAGHARHPDQLVLYPGAGKALGSLKRAGAKLIVVSNQSAVARGWLTPAGTRGAWTAVYVPCCAAEGTPGSTPPSTVPTIPSTPVPARAAKPAGDDPAGTPLGSIWIRRRSVSWWETPRPTWKRDARRVCGRCSCSPGTGGVTVRWWCEAEAGRQDRASTSPGLPGGSWSKPGTVRG